MAAALQHRSAASMSASRNVMADRHTRGVFVIFSRLDTESNWWVVRVFAEKAGALDCLSTNSRPQGLYRHPDGDRSPGKSREDEDRWYSLDLHLKAERVVAEGFNRE